MSTNVSSILAASTSNRLTGLMSNMDVDEIVKNMSQGTISKISKLDQKRQNLEWKQTAYRAVTTSLLNFSNTFLSSSSTTNLSKSSFFKSAVVTSLGSNASAASVTGTIDSVRNFSIGSISRLATTAGVTTAADHKVSSRNVTTGLIDLMNGRDISALEDTSVALTYGSNTYYLNLSEIPLSTKTDDAARAQENAENVVAALNSALKSEGLSDSLAAELGTDGKVTFNEINNAGNELKVEAGSTALLNILGLKTGDIAKDGELTGRNNIKTDSLVKQVTFGESIASGGGTFTFDLDGVKAVINLKDLVNDDGSFKDADMTMKKLTDHINAQLAKSYGAGKVAVSAVDENGSPLTSGATQGKLVFETSSSTSILSVSSGDRGVLGATGAMNMNFGDANRLLVYEPLSSSKSNLNTSLDFSGGKTYSMTVNDTVFEVGSDFIMIDGEKKEFAQGVTINDIMSTINSSDAGVTVKYLSTSDRFSIIANDPGSIGKIDISGELGEALFGESNTLVGAKQGTDSEMQVSFDGGTTYETITRTSNSFTIDGVNVTLKSTFTSKDVDATAGSGDAITFSAKANADEVVSAIKSMVEKYNEMISEINSAVSTKPIRNRSGGALTYQPLTDEQRKDMSESEISAWEEKAQQGILFADPLLRTLSSDLRFVFSNQVDGVSMNQIGIKAGSTYKDNGKLSFNETMFRKALEEKPDAVAKLFTSNGSVNEDEKGAIAKLGEIMNKYASTSGSKKGSLIQKAGHASSPTSELNNAIFTQIKSLSEQIDTLEKKLISEQDRYYSKFTALEVYLNKMNSQASWLMDQTSS